MGSNIQDQGGATGLRLGIVVSRFNVFVTEKLFAGAMAALTKRGAKDEDIIVVHVPGAFEIGLAARKLAESKSVDAVICLGCVIRGETPHFDFIAAETARAINDVGLTTGVPTTFGVLTTDTVEQALERAGGKVGNKGEEAANSALEMIQVLRSIAARTNSA